MVRSRVSIAGAYGWSEFAQAAPTWSPDGYLSVDAFTALQEQLNRLEMDSNIDGRGAQTREGVLLRVVEKSWPFPLRYSAHALSASTGWNMIETRVSEPEAAALREERRPRALFLCALDLEQEALWDHLEPGAEPLMDPFGTVISLGTFEGRAGVQWEVGTVCTGAGNTSAAVVTTLAVQAFHPACVFFVGIAGGLPDPVEEEVALGDVVAATMVYPLRGKLKRDGPVIRPHALGCSYRLSQVCDLVASSSARNMLGRTGVWQDRIAHKVALATGKPKVHRKPIVATDFVINTRSGEVFDALKEAYTDAYAVEMEGYGFLAATTRLGVDGLVVRGVSDHIYPKEPDADAFWQPIAMRHAAAFAFEVLFHYSGGGDFTKRDPVSGALRSGHVS